MSTIGESVRPARTLNERREPMQEERPNLSASLEPRMPETGARGPGLCIRDRTAVGRKASRGAKPEDVATIGTRAVKEDLVPPR